MTWQSVAVVAHEPSRTLVRAHGGNVQVLRDGAEVARLFADGRASDTLAITPSGTVFVGEGFVDVTAPKPTIEHRRSVAASGHRAMHPSGAAAMVLTHAAADDPNTAAHVRATHARVPRDRFQLAWARGDALEVLAEGDARFDGGGRAFTYGGHPRFADDGEHWAVLVVDVLEGARGVIVGRGERVLAHHRLRDVWLDRVSFDLAHGVLYVGAYGGLQSFSLDDGRALAARAFERGDPLRSALLPMSDALVAVRAMETPDRYALCHVDRDTLEPGEPLEGVPARDDIDGRFALARLGSRGIAWAPAEQPIWLVDADDWAPGPLAQRPSELLDGVALPTDLARATSAEREALALHLLERRTRDPRFVPLARAHPESFHPHLATLLAWPREWKDMVRDIDRDRWAGLARGASDELVDAIANAAAESRPGAPDVELLVAADTPHALARLADLARARPDVAEWCRQWACLEIPARGPAVRRFDPNERVLHAMLETEPRISGATALATRLTPSAWLEPARAIECLRPPTHLLAVPLELVACDPHPHVAAFHFALSDCGACQEWSGQYRARARADGRMTLVSNWLEKIDAREARRCCPGREPAQPPSARRVELGSFDPSDIRDPLGHVGGRPDWTQDADHPDCPTCGRMMFFVAQLDSYLLDVHFSDVFGFVCERCAITMQVRQNT